MGDKTNKLIRLKATSEGKGNILHLDDLPA